MEGTLHSAAFKRSQQAKQVSSSKRRRCGAEERAKNKETRIGGWGGDPGLGGMRVGGPARLTLLRGQRITVASASAQAVTKVFAGAVQLVT